MQYSFTKFGCKIVSPNPNFYPGGFHHLKANPFSTLLPIQAARKKEISCSSESWQPGDPVEPTVSKNCFQAQIVTDIEINCENMQAVVGSIQGALKPGDGADKDARRVGTEPVVASAAPSELSGLCASLA